MTTNKHRSVMIEEAINALSIQADHWYVDATFGQGGHTTAILEKNGKVIGFEWDRKTFEQALSNFTESIEMNELILKHLSFTNLQETIGKLSQEKKVDKISGILFDFGTSTDQLKSSERGFSFEGDGPLDMRMDERLGVQAKDILAIIPTKQLAKLFFDYGGEKDAWKIAQAIKKHPTPITTIGTLRDLVIAVKGDRKGKLHPATKIFQSLRIAVNTELENITEVLPQALAVLDNQGIIVTISFHEGEDRIVKHTFREWESSKLGKILTPRALQPSDQELINNSRSRSAKLRSFQKITK